MCGRFTLTLSGDMLADWFEVVDGELDLVPRYNIAPTQEVLAITSDGERRHGQFMHWGLIPSWAKDLSIGSKMINARAETLMEKASFKQAFAKRRCLVLADGFYEWKREGKTKRPMRITFKSGEPFGFAGLWETWRDKANPNAQPITSCTIITCGPNSLMEPIHNRMPVILPREYHKDWLNPGNSKTSELMELLGPYDPTEMVAYKVSPIVNNVKNQGPELVRPVTTLG